MATRPSCADRSFMRFQAGEVMMWSTLRPQESKCTNRGGLTSHSLPHSSTSLATRSPNAHKSESAACEHVYTYAITWSYLPDSTDPVQLFARDLIVTMRYLMFLQTKQKTRKTPPCFTYAKLFFAAHQHQNCLVVQRVRNNIVNVICIFYIRLVSVTFCSKTTHTTSFLRQYRGNAAPFWARLPPHLLRQVSLQVSSEQSIL